MKHWLKPLSISTFFLFFRKDVYRKCGIIINSFLLIIISFFFDTLCCQIHVLFFLFRLTYSIKKVPITYFTHFTSLNTPLSIFPYYPMIYATYLDIIIYIFSLLDIYINPSIPLLDLLIHHITIIYTHGINIERKQVTLNNNNIVVIITTVELLL